MIEDTTVPINPACPHCGSQWGAIPCPLNEPPCDVQHFGCVPCGKVACTCEERNMEEKMTTAKWLAEFRRLVNMVPADITLGATEAELRCVDLARATATREEHIALARAERAELAAYRQRVEEREEESHRRWCAVNNQDMEHAKARLAEKEKDARRLELYEREVQLYERCAAALEAIAGRLKELTTDRGSDAEPDQWDR